MNCLVWSLGAVVMLFDVVSFGTQLEPRQDDESKITQSGGGMLPLSARCVSESVRKVVPTSVHWQGRDHDAATGVELLMRVIQDPTISPDKRALALDRLGMLGQQLKGRKCLDEIVELYGTVGTRDEKAGVLSCLLKSENPRGLRLLYQVLDSEKDPILRLLAANGLARWNIRRGVQELIELVPSDVKLGDRQLGGEAAGAFHFLNQAKGWGCPDEEILQAAASGSGGQWNQYVAALVQGFRKWFGQNKDRFPDWKPGDPLPEVRPEEDKEAGEE